MPDNDSLIQQLHRVRHFRNLPLTDIAAIVTAGRVKRFSSGEMLFHEEQPGAGLFVLLSGLVHLVKTGPQGQEFIMAVIKPVIMFNEVAALDCGPNPAGARAAEDCLVWNVSCERFQDLLDRYPVVGLGLLRVMATRNRQLVSQYESLCFRPVLARVAGLLNEISQAGQDEIDRRKYSNTRLAAMVPTVPEVFSRVMKTLSREGLISLTRDSIRVNDTPGLKNFAEGALEIKGD